MPSSDKRLLIFALCLLFVAFASYFYLASAKQRQVAQNKPLSLWSEKEICDEARFLLKTQFDDATLQKLEPLKARLVDGDWIVTGSAPFEKVVENSNNTFPHLEGYVLFTFSTKDGGMWFGSFNKKKTKALVQPNAEKAFVKTK
jgi:hypothetical protein